jgi:hypothetical protein
VNSVQGLLGALRGPILLITLGILLLLQRFADASFGKTWPILLIVFGVMKLVERMISGGNQPPLAGTGNMGGPLA